MTSPLVRLFLITLFSTLSLHASTDNGESGDRFNFSSLVARSGEGSVTSFGDLPDGIKAVNVKDQGNQNDPDTGLGMVTQEYSIAQTEVTAHQYCKYLNVVATGENYLLFYNEKMGTDPNVASITRNVINGKNQYRVINDEHGDRKNFPIVYVNLYQAARFCNWLQNKDTPGLTGDGLTERGAYTLYGKNSGPIVRNPGAVWFIPTESEWYKPAYYKGGGLREGYWNFANRSDWAPSNSLKATVNAANYYCSSYTKNGPPYLTPVNYFKKSVGTYNTYDMGGNVAEWVATEEENGKYVARGGSWKSSYYGTTILSKCDVADWGFDLSKWARPVYDPTQGYDNIGFRVATSILVDSPAPSGGAPGMAELSPTATLTAPFVFLVGMGAIVAAEKIGDPRRDVATRRRQVEEQQKRMRERTENDVEEDDKVSANDEATQNASSGQGFQKHMQGGISLSVLQEFFTPSPSTQQQIEEFKQQREEMQDQGLLPGTPASIASSQQEEKSIVQSQKKLVIGPFQQEEIRRLMGKINPLFTAAVKKHQAFKRFLKERGETDPGGLAQLETTCDAYDAYAGAVLEAADKIKEQFSEEQKVWSPWYRTAIHVVFEVDLLRDSMLTPYESLGLSINRSEVIRLRNVANQKALDSGVIFKNYLNLLNEHVPKDANELESDINELEKYQQEMREALAKYEKNREISPMINLVDASQLKEKMEQILIQRAIFSPGSAGGFASIYNQGKLESIDMIDNPLSPINLTNRFNQVQSSNKGRDEDINSQQSENSDHEDEMSPTCTIM
ncbi:MAG: SUMF1/EgtB/PvdO family nonheme iron enzyme [Chthoniobacterales bacterium]|nr:SUMF1/EgtB/PvdO family nonheme iron enzyme [Chthoniobacterales bacterium]